jgi:hypothetical protein
MKRKQKPQLFLFGVAIVVVLIFGHNLKKYYLDKNYLDEAITACNPLQHSCFEADPNNPNPDLQVPIYEKVEVEAANAPACLDEHSCKEFTCTGTSCRITYCSAESKEAGEVCSNEIE